MADLPVITIFGALNVQLQSRGPVPDVETRELDCRCYSTDVDIWKILATDRPVAIVSFGTIEQFPRLLALPFNLRRRWLHFPHGTPLERVGAEAFHCFLTDATTPREAPPLVTVFTPAYRTGERIHRPLRSLLAQSYSEWEWIVLDDSGDDGATFEMLNGIAATDSRIGVFRSHRQSGVIGEVKRQAAMLGRGSILVELDHDDELTVNGLADIVGAFRAFPDAGFAYTDCAEVFEAGGNATYPEGWGFGYGQTHEFIYQGRQYLAHRAPCINSKTIRHIVSAPNHIRAWKRDFYDEIGGHSPLLHVADDYELCLRTFLHTRMIQVRTLGYIQYYNQTGNTQRRRNKDIQRLVRTIQHAYESRIHERLLSLGVDDFAWNPTIGQIDWMTPNPEHEPHASLIFDPPKR